MADYTVSTVFTAVTAPLQAGTARAGAALRSFQVQALGSSQASKTLGQNLAETAGSARLMGVPLAKLAGPAGLLLGVGAGLSASAKAAIAWESAFADVQKTVSGTPQQLAAIETGLRDMSTAIPMAAEGLAAIAANAGQLGIETDSVLAFTETMAALGVTTNLSAEQAATELARLANITGMSQDQFSNLGSSIVELGNNFATTESEISSMAMRIAAAGSQVGLTEGDILGLAAALTSVGINAEAGGTAISRVLIDMSKEVDTGGAKLEQFAEVAGMTGSQFAATFRNDAGGALVAFVQGLDRMSQAGGNVFGTLEELELADIRVQQALLGAAGASDLFTDAMETGNEAFEENTALAEEAAVRFETTASKMTVLGNSFSELARSVGEEALPEINAVLDVLIGLAGAADTAVDALAGLKDVTPEEGTEVARRAVAMAEMRVADMEALGLTRELEQAKKDLADAEALQAEATKGAAEAQGHYYDRAWPASRVTEEAAAASEELAAQQEEVAEAAEEAAEAIDGFKDAVDAALGAEFDLQDASDAVTQSLISLTDQVKDAKDAENEHATALQGNRREALANRDAFQEVVEAVGAEIQAMADHNQSSDEMQAKINEGKERLRELADQLGFTEEDVDHYVDAIDAIPVSKYTDIENTAFEAMSDVERYIATINSIPKNYHSTVTITTRHRSVGVGGPVGGGFLEGNRAVGGPVWPGMFLVGEQGPELVQMAGRGFVHNNQATRNMLGGDPIAGARALGIPGMAAGGVIQADSLAEAILRGPRSAAANLGFPQAGRYRNYGGFRINEEQQLNRATALFAAAPLKEQRRTLEILLANAADYSDLWVELSEELGRVNTKMADQADTYADLKSRQLQIERDFQRDVASLEEQHATQREARLQQRREQILGFRSPFQTAGGNDVMGGTRFTAGGVVQESFGQAMLRNLQGQTAEIDAWRQGLSSLRAAGASESLIETLGLDASPAQLSAVRALLDDVETLGSLNRAITSRAGSASSAVSYEIAGGYGQTSRDLTEFRADLSAGVNGLVEALKKDRAEMVREISDFLKTADLDGKSLTLVTESGPISAVVRMGLDSYARDASQRTRMAGL